MAAGFVHGGRTARWAAVGGLRHIARRTRVKVMLRIRDRNAISGVGGPVGGGGRFRFLLLSKEETTKYQ